MSPGGKDHTVKKRQSNSMRPANNQLWPASMYVEPDRSKIGTCDEDDGWRRFLNADFLAQHKKYDHK
jgi:hypothetical protein